MVTDSRTIIVILSVHKEYGIKASDRLQTSPRHQPSRGIHRVDPITATQLATVGIEDKLRRLGRKIVKQEATIQASAGAVEVNRTRYARIVVIKQENQ
jgi:hypothetical protein